MDRSYVIRTLRQHEKELKDAGILHLRLFGSLARDEAAEHSDIDLLAEFDNSGASFTDEGWKAASATFGVAWRARGPILGGLDERARPVQSLE